MREKYQESKIEETRHSKQVETKKFIAKNTIKMESVQSTQERIDWAKEYSKEKAIEAIHMQTMSY